jgi:dolichol kinase
MEAMVLNFEIRRKIFHLQSLVFPLFYLFISKTIAALLLLVLTGIVLYLDISRHYNPKIRNCVDKFFANLMRKPEKSGSFGLSGASFMITGFLISGLLFPKNLAITSWFILIISDALAAIVGIKIGTKIYNGKTLEGSSAFLSSAILISIICHIFIGYKTSFVVIIISSLATTTVEFYSNKPYFNDNLLIPITYGLSTIIFNFILGV